MDSTSMNHEDGLRDDHELHNEETQNLTQESVERGKRKLSEGSGSASDQNKTQRTLPTRSGAWAHYTRLENNRDKCVCNYCQRELTCPTSSCTKNLWNHMQTCKEFKAWEDGQDPTQSQKVIYNEGQLQSAKVSELVFREAVNQMLVIEELPLALVENTTFRHFCNKVNLYKPHSRSTATRDIVKMFVERKSALKQWFLASKQRVSLTTDILVSQVTGASYMVISAHYVDNNWRLKKLIIGFKYVTDHKGKTISNTLLECLPEWGIEKVFCVTVDNATANINALSLE
ncbi:hypothetical protein AALP_AA2G123000 [Arabis alpina]|uniref:BED-type domain-containing protein n=1 Tax=Arabis alpina TaxID=50452 RepID=A0A087HGX8_ARAAL|nr:hypothetical protein AALP_AA2G123000 [Arabis alpina]